MGLDSENESVREASLKDLKNLAGSPKRHMYEEAVYLLGLYQINNGELAEAQGTWKALQDEQLEDVGYSVDSPWKKVVADKVKSIS
jgi:predicted NUDIX family NTP pyrophosphohydrolase